MNKIISTVSATLLAIVVSANCFGQGKPISTPKTSKIHSIPEEKKLQHLFRLLRNNKRLWLKRKN